MTRYMTACLAPEFKERLTHCYELSGRYVLNNGGVLVHGTIQGRTSGMEPIGHGWVELPNGNLWEPITNEEWSPEDFTEVFQGTTIWRYPEEEAIENMVWAGHFGPWDED